MRFPKRGPSPDQYVAIIRQETKLRDVIHLLHLNLYIDAARQFKLHQSIDCLGAG